MSWGLDGKVLDAIRRLLHDRDGPRKRSQSHRMRWRKGSVGACTLRERTCRAVMVRRHSSREMHYFTSPERFQFTGGAGPSKRHHDGGAKPILWGVDCVLRVGLLFV